MSKRKIYSLSQGHLSTFYLYHMLFNYYYFIYLVQHLLKFGTQLGNATALFVVHTALLMQTAISAFRKTRVHSEGG